MTGNSKKHFFKVLNKNFLSFFRVKTYFFVKETKDFYLNPLNKIIWGPDERSASDLALNSY